MSGTAATSAPLLAARNPGAPIAWRGGRPIEGQAFLTAASALAARLPAGGRAINLCQDRLHFALGLVAGLMRGATNLMPPNALPATLRRLPESAADAGPLYLLVDDEAPPDTGLEAVRVSYDPAAGPSDAPVPTLDVRHEAVCLLTSGSTGAPQPHVKRWGALVTNIGSEAERLAEALGRPTLAGLTIVATVPPQHSYGFESSVLLALLGGAALEAGRPFYPADIAAALAAVPAPRALVTTPFHLKALLRSGVALPPVALVLSATAPLSPQLAAEAEAAMGATLVEIYGCTEAGQVASRRTTAGETWTTLGALRLRREAAEGREAFIVEGGHVLEPTPLADVLELVDARRFRLLGRANDLIHVAGKRSSLAHLNYHLNRIPGVEDGAFWLPDGADTEAVVRPVAFVVAPRLAAAAIIGALRAELEPAFVPRRVIHVDALPHEATGKITADALRDFALAALARADAQKGPAAAPAAAPREGVGAAPAPSGPAGGMPLTCSAQHAVPVDHPAFAGHFPGQPLLPGVALLTLVLRTLAAAPALAARAGATPLVEQVKFLSPVGPGSTVTVQLDVRGSGIDFECRVAGRIAARGRLAGGRAGARPA